MTAFLSDEWLDEAQTELTDLPVIDGANGVVQYVISEAPDGKVQAHVEVRSGQVTKIARGKHPEPDCTVSLGYTDAVDLLVGELSPEVAFMSGRAKVEGDHRVWLLDLRPVRSTDEAAAAISSLRKTTST